MKSSLVLLRFRLRGVPGLIGLLFVLVGFIRATTVVPPDFPTLVNEADVIVRAIVKSVTSKWESDAHGRRIVSQVELEVTEVIAGSPPPVVVLQVLGGRVGDEEMAIEGAPLFAVGDDAILFVQGNGRQIVPLVRMAHGQYPIVRDPGTGREVVARSNKVPLSSTAEIALPMTGGAAARLQQRQVAASRALTPAEFARQIQAVRQAGNLHAKQH